MRNKGSRSLAAVLVVALLVGPWWPLGARLADAVGHCGVYKTFVNEVLTASDLNNSLTQAAVTNSTPQCVDNYSATVAQMQTVRDPYPSSTESLATTLADELASLRYQFKSLCGTSQWYVRCNPLTPPGDLNLGVASTRAGTLSFYHPSSAFKTAFQAGNATSAMTYTLPATPPTVNGATLTSTTLGVLSWGNGNIEVGQASTAPASQLDFFHPSSAFRTSFQAASATVNTTYYWPTTYPTAANQMLTGGTDGTLAWATGPVFTKSFTSSDQTITSAGTLTLAHGLGGAPALIRLQLVCQTGELNYSAGDVVEVSMASTSNSVSQSPSVTSDATNVYITYGANANAFALADKSTGSGGFITNGNWKLRVKAWR